MTLCNYPLLYGQEYANRYAEAIISKSEFSDVDIKALSFFFDTRHKTIPGAWHIIYSNFKEIEHRLIQAIMALDETSAILCKELFSTHLKIAFNRLSPLDPNPDIIRFIKELTLSELKIMDEFSLDYSNLRGLYHKDRFLGVRTTGAYYTWTNQVKMRDSFTCQRCGGKDNLVAHHIKPVSEAPEFATDIHNGITLCEKCHDAYHQSRRPSQCYAENLFNFIEYYRRAKQCSQ